MLSLSLRHHLIIQPGRESAVFPLVVPAGGPGGGAEGAVGEEELCAAVSGAKRSEAKQSVWRRLWFPFARSGVASGVMFDMGGLFVRREFIPDGKA
jgi:hypothetical protein